jgi:hypothetical protein
MTDAPEAHASSALLARYAGGDPDIPPAALWALDTHLESCPECRRRVGEVVRRQEPATAALLERVRIGLDAEIAGGTAVPRRRRGRAAGRIMRWVTPTAVPWLAMTVLVVLTAVGFDLAVRAAGGQTPSLVLLLAPVSPLFGVAAAWARGRDPAHELVAATPRAGLYLVFRRTLAVLAVVIPVLAGAGLLVGASPARWLVPCLAFTVAALALGELIGLTRAAAGLALLWTATVVAPSLAMARVPGLLEPASVPGWAAVTAAVTVVLMMRRHGYARVRAGR